MQEYTCPSCLKIYTTLHAAALIKSDGLFHCEDCDIVLEICGAVDHGETINRRERTKLVKAKQVQISIALQFLMCSLQGTTAPFFSLPFAFVSQQSHQKQNVFERGMVLESDHCFLCTPL